MPWGTKDALGVTLGHLGSPWVSPQRVLISGVKVYPDDLRGAVGHTGWVWTRWSCVHTIHHTSIRWHLKKGYCCL